ncbi:MAG TPA: thioredoxin family protein [Candidatus Xenobia bacterium]|jgi:thiol:disulfide interchange protein
MAPIVDGLKDKYQDQMTFVRVDVNQADNRGLDEKYGIEGTPTMIIVGKDGKAKPAIAQVMEAPELEAHIKQVL